VAKQMKKTFTLIVALVAMSISAQSKKELELAIVDFSRRTVMNKSYDDYDKLWDAIYAVQQMEYPEITRESKEKGYIEARFEKQHYKEKLNIEILGQGPYRLSFSFQSEQTTPNGIEKRGMIPEHYLHKIQREIYEKLYGTIEYPAELLKKIEAYNSTQNKHKKKLIQGRDF
jgi:hypothetical protein